MTKKDSTISDVMGAIEDLAISTAKGFEFFGKKLETEIQSVRTDLGKEIQSVRSDLGKEIQSVRTDLGKEIQSVRSDLGHKIDLFRSEMMGEFRRLEK